MRKIYAIMGKSGVGKTTIVRKLSELLGVKEAISVTSRPKRINEVDGVDYYFKTKEEILKLDREDKLAEFNIYNGNCYGIEKKEFDVEGDVLVVVDPNGYRSLRYMYERNVVPVYIYTTDEKRKDRLLSRIDKRDKDALKEVELRYRKDDKLFEKIERDKRINKINNSTDLLSAVSQLSNIMGIDTI